MSPHEPEATPAQQEAVRRLLAEARHEEPLPADVAARLDDVLADLVAEGPRGIAPPPPSGAPPAPPTADGADGADGADRAVVVDLAARRRRRRARALLVAAAAVVVVGVGVGRLVDRPGSDAGSSVTSGDDAGRGDAGAESFSSQDESGEQDSSPDGAAPPPAAGPSEPGGTSGSRAADVPTVTSAGFRRSVLELRDAEAVTSFSSGTLLQGSDLTTDSLFVCPATDLGAGRLVPVTYAGSPGVLAYRPATGATQTVELLQCGTGAVVRSVVVPSS